MGYKDRSLSNTIPSFGKWFGEKFTFFITIKVEINSAVCILS